MQNLKEKMYSWMVSELVQAQEAGQEFCVDGHLYSSDQAEQLHMVMEDGYYMKSYVNDESGKIIQIDFEHINNV